MSAKTVYYMHAKVNFCESITGVHASIWHTIYTHFHETIFQATYLTDIRCLLCLTWKILSWHPKVSLLKKSNLAMKNGLPSS